MEAILQFGAGRFLRAFADCFVHQANAAGQDAGRIVVVQSTPGARAEGLTKRGGRYHVLLRGYRAGTLVDEAIEVASISRALVALDDWPAILDFARSPHLHTILSNTTEAGYELHAGDGPQTAAPHSFPAKLLQALASRHEARQPGVTILPCELFEHNARKLFGVVDGLAAAWGLPADFRAWLRDECRWRNALVDRIVIGTPAGHPLLADDPMLIAAEPYGLWAIERPAGAAPAAGEFDHPCVRRVPDVVPYHLRKVRILNGAHTALVAHARPRGFTTVRAAVEDPAIGAWLHDLVFGEIVPTLAGQVEGAEEFARQTLERFRNPFLEHQLADIAVNHDLKVQVRLLPTRAEFAAKFGKQPPLLSALLG